MTDHDDSRTAPAARDACPEDAERRAREARLAAALRDNLRRRKAAGRRGGTDSGGGADTPGD